MTREEAIDLLDNLIGMVEDNHNSDYDKALKMAIKSLEQEPCDKYIKEIDHLRKYISKLETQIVEQEPKTGQWIRTDKRIKDNLYVWKVTCCGREFIADADLKSRDNYCLNCGAKIESEDICSTTQLTI